MSTFNQEFHINEKDGTITNIDEIKKILELYHKDFGDTEFSYIEILINYLVNSNIKNRYELISILKKYQYNHKLNSNEEATDYLKKVWDLKIGIICLGEDNYYLYYYQDEKLKLLECLQKYDLANYVNTYSKDFKDKETIIEGYINYLRKTLNFNPILNETEIDKIDLGIKNKLTDYLHKKNINNYKIYIDQNGEIFVISATAIIHYEKKNQQFHFIKSEDIFENTLVEDINDYADIPILLPFELDRDRLKNLIDNIERISNYDKRYLESSIKTIIEKTNNFDADYIELLNEYVRILKYKINECGLILTKTEKEVLARTENMTDEVKKSLKFNNNGGFIIVLMELLILGTYLVSFIILA